MSGMRKAIPKKPTLPKPKKRLAKAAEAESRPSKRQRTDVAPPPKQATPATAGLTERQAATDTPKNPPASVLRTEENAFPRGGANVLTPLEHKQIQIEATRDALFEESGLKRRPPSDVSDEDNTKKLKDEVKKLKRRKTVKDSKHGAPFLQEEFGGKIEGLSYRRLVPGSLVLGQITQITSRDIALALPNNLTGYVPLTAISDQLTKRVERMLAEEEEADEEEEEARRTEEHGFEDVELDKMFTIGQYLRACVTFNGNDSGGKHKKRIELSLNPRFTNSGLLRSDVVVDSMIQASVVSVEDNGLVMDIALPDTDIKGFIGATELGANFDHNTVSEGTVFLCLVTGLSANGRIVKLSADYAKAGNLKKSHSLSVAPSINAFLPGTAVDVMITDVTNFGIRGKVMGMLDVTADQIHAAGAQGQKTLEKKYSAGMKIKSRILFTYPKDEVQRVGISVLEHILSLSLRCLENIKSEAPLEQLPVASIVEDAKVTKVESALGLFMDVGVPRVQGFAHISRLSDKKIDLLSEDTGQFKLGSIHRARIVGFNPIDGLFIISLEQKVLDQPFLRIADIKIGALVHGVVERLVINERGVGGILVNLADGITGLVPEMHMADIHLQHPDRKFREGMKVTARVLSTNLDKNLIRLTLKKTLVNSEAKQWTSYDSIRIGDRTPSTLVKILPNGAVVQFYGDVRGFLPVAEMSEAFIKDPREHFRLGQVVNVHVLSVDHEARTLRVSCKDPSSSGPEQQKAFSLLKIGQTVSGVVTEIAPEMITVELASGVKGILRSAQLSDGSEKQNASVVKGLRARQKLHDLLLLEKMEGQQIVALSKKPSLLKAANNGLLLSSFDQIQANSRVSGFVKNITEDGIFVQFAGGLVGLLPCSGMPEGMKLQKSVSFGMRSGQSISANIWNTDPSRKRFSLTLREDQISPNEVSRKTKRAGAVPETRELINPVDNVSTTIDDFSIGKKTIARIRAVKDFQMNVFLADNVTGRIHVSEIYKDWASIPDPKRPLKQFKTGPTIPVKLIGTHEAKTQKYLPLSHRNASHSVFECSAKQVFTDGVEALTLGKLAVGEERVAFITHFAGAYVFADLAPELQGVIDIMELATSTDGMKKDYPIGCALRVRVKSLDPSKNQVHLNLLNSDAGPQSLQDLKIGDILTARVTKVAERDVGVRLSQEVHGSIMRTELADDYDEVDPNTYNRSDIVRVRVVDIDLPNQKLLLSARPSLISPTSSSIRVKDRFIAAYEDLKPNDVVRGFIKTVNDHGLFVWLGPNITAYVGYSEVSERFSKDWKAGFEANQLVKGKVILCDPIARILKLSLKPSVVNDQNWQPQRTWADLEKGQVVDGTVASVFDYGVFILMQHSRGIRGLCHRSEIADGKTKDVSKLYEVGDKVKAKILLVDKVKKRVNFGLKTSYFTNLDDEYSENNDSANSQTQVDNQTSADRSKEEIGASAINEFYEDENEGEEPESDAEDPKGSIVNRKAATKFTGGLDIGDFDWTGDTVLADDVSPQLEADQEHPQIRKRRKAEIQVDKTGELDKDYPRSVADFERRLLGQPNSSALWIQYMAFQLGLSEIEKAREIARRALQTVNMREEDEKLNIWVAWLNLENAYGTEDTLESVFEQGCQYCDKKELHERLVSIYIDSGKHEEAESLFERMRKIRDISLSPSYWINYATFLITTKHKADSARTLLQRATQSLPGHEHRHIISRFAALEFQSPNGDPERGRTMFEGLVETYRKRWDVWDMYLDLELSNGDKEKARDLLERMAKEKMKPRRAKYVFKRWLEFEEGEGGKKGVDRVKFLAAEYVDLHEQRGEVVG